MKCANCGHDKRDHIHEEGACRPGFKCLKACAKFVMDHSGWYHRTERHYTLEVFHWAGVSQGPDNGPGNVYGPFPSADRARKDAIAYHKTDIAYAQRAIDNIKGGGP